MRKKASTKSSVSSPSGPLQSVCTRGDGLLVVMELGAEWPTGLLRAGVGASSATARRVLTQVEGETPLAFCERVAGSLDTLFDRKIQLEVVVLACNERLDEAAEFARRRTLSLTLGRMAMAKHQSGHVYLSAPARSSGRLRHALSSLAQGLFDEWDSAGLEVSVDFSEASEVRAESKPFSFTARVA